MPVAWLAGLVRPLIEQTIEFISHVSDLAVCRSTGNNNPLRCSRFADKPWVMLQIIIKVLLTSVLVVAISEAGKRSALLGAILASLPLTSLLAFLWLYAETGDTTKIASLSLGICWLVLPSLILFIALPMLLRAGWTFPLALAVSIGLTASGYAVMLMILRRFGIEI